MIPVEGPGAKVAAHDLAVVRRAVLGGGQAGRDDDRGREEDKLAHGVAPLTKRLVSSPPSTRTKQARDNAATKDTERIFIRFDPQAFWEG